MNPHDRPKTGGYSHLAKSTVTARIVYIAGPPPTGP